MAIPPGPAGQRAGPAGPLRLVVQFCQDRGLPFLDVRSSVDPGQSFLLPAGHRPVMAGLSLHTRLGRIHALYWGLAYGVGEPPAGTVVRFESVGLRHGRSVDVVAHRVARHGWVADADGVFTSAALVVDGRVTDRVRLSDRW